ncbi:MAG: MAPEG family protein [Casimicrobiaceae bacterium]
MLIVVPVTALYAGVCALLLLVLASLISRHRIKHRIGLGDGGNAALTRAIHAHGNAVEWMLPMLLLLLIAELNHTSHLLLHVCGVAFVFARIAHAVGLTRHHGESSGRKLGTLVSWTVIAVLAILNIVDFTRTLLV